MVFLIFLINAYVAFTKLESAGHVTFEKDMYLAQGKALFDKHSESMLNYFNYGS